MKSHIEWFKKEWSLRQYLRRRFVHQYAFSSWGVMECYANAIGQDAKLLDPPWKELKELGAECKVIPTSTGYTFEAFIPAQALPAAAEAPLKTVRVMVDIIDQDTNPSAGEVLISSSPARHFGKPATFNSAILPASILWDSPCNLLKWLFKEKKPAAYYYPDKPVSAFYPLENRYGGDRFDIWMELLNRKIPLELIPVTKVAKAEVVLVPKNNSFYSLAAIRNGRLIDVLDLPIFRSLINEMHKRTFRIKAGDILSDTRSQNTHLILTFNGSWLEEETYYPFYSTMGAGCLVLRCYLVAIDDEGHLKSLINPDKTFGEKKMEVPWGQAEIFVGKGFDFGINYSVIPFYCGADVDNSFGQYLYTWQPAQQRYSETNIYFSIDPILPEKENDLKCRCLVNGKTPPPGTVCRWNFGDGTPLQHGIETHHVYRQPGKYKISVHFTMGSIDTTMVYSLQIYEPGNP